VRDASLKTYRTRTSLRERLCLVSTIPLPFFRSVANVAVAGENGNAGNVFPYTPGSSDHNADWLSNVHQRQNGKK